MEEFLHNWSISWLEGERPQFCISLKNVQTKFYYRGSGGGTGSFDVIKHTWGSTVIYTVIEI